MSTALSKLFESVKHPRILVVGDLVLDRYVWGNVDRISPEGPIPVLRVSSEEKRPGGAGNVVNNLRRLEAEVSVCGVIGEDRTGASLKTQFEELGAGVVGVTVQPNRTTSVKTRYLGFVQSAQRGVQHMLRVDHENIGPISADAEEQIIAQIQSLAPKQQAIVVSDYDKGLLTERVLASVYEAGRAAGVPVVTDPKMARPYSVYSGTTVITPNRYETRVAIGVAPNDGESLAAAAKRLREQVAARDVVITLDRDGMYVAGEAEPGLWIPVQAREVYDVNGAGDMVVSVIALMLASGASIREAAMIANIAAGIEVSKLGAASVSRSEIAAELLAGTDIGPKLKSVEAAVKMAEETRRRNGKVIWTNGCFDLFHIGHYEFLRFARRQGDLLLVGLNSDDSVRRIKGPNRPITSRDERVRVLAALDVVDGIVLFEEDTPAALIEAIRPEVIVKGSDYRPDEVVGRELVESWGGRVVLAPIVEGFSTTDLVNRILELHKNANTQDQLSE